MTLLPAKIVAVVHTGDQYQVVVRIEMKYQGSFNNLAFGENKAFTGSYRNGSAESCLSSRSALRGGPGPSSLDDPAISGQEPSLRPA
jgi:hypothetical protein